MTDFAELGARSNFSFLDGASHPEELVGHLPWAVPFIGAAAVRR
jgi:DNA polymerase III alpha subunit